MHRHLALAHVLVLNTVCFGQTRPSALQEFEQHRKSIKTMQIEWSVESPKLAHVETMRQAAGVRFGTTKIATDDVLFIQRGDARGVVVTGADGKPSSAMQTPIQSLARDAEVWQHQQDSLLADLRPKGAWSTPMDFRSLGAAPLFDSAGIQDAFWNDGSGTPAPREYSESTEDGLRVIAAKSDYGTTRWWLDPKLDWNPVRTAFFDDKGVVMETRLTYKKFDNVWFPDSAAGFSRDYKDGKEPGIIYRIIAASINRPEQPTRLTPADLGMEAGINVMKYDAELKPLGTFMFDGVTAVPVQEYNRRVTAGELQPGLRVQAGFQRLKELPANAPAKVKDDARKQAENDPWRIYTRDFIERFSLDGPQIQKAWLICRECQDRRDNYLNGKRDEFDAFNRVIADAKNDESATAQAKAGLTKLMKPVEEIFDEGLKPRLEKLPTRAQRTAAEARDAEREKAAKLSSPK
jgi:hypothetical protein